VTFQGWPAAAVDFYDGLDEDNSKAYWAAHKTQYDEAVRAPMDALLRELAPEFGVGKVFRPYRDVRFSKDKRPYKEHIGAVCTDEAGRTNYVQLSAAGLLAGGGAYQLDPAHLDAVRRAVADDRTGAELERIVATLRTQGLELGGDALRTAPRGYPKDHPRIALLRQKAFWGYREWPVEPWLETREVLEHVRHVWRACTPLHDWLEGQKGLKG
jgi:uncharacterized protein (TIGR02453 family)